MVEVKKYFLVVVEGPTDRTSFENVLRKIFERINPDKGLEIDVVHGDLLTVDKNKKLIPYNQEEENVSIQIQKKIKSLHLKPSDVIAIAMITDLDACFAPESFFVENQSIEKALYNVENNNCERKNISDLIKVRRKKLSVIRRMHNKTHINIGGTMIKYRLFYVNVDLEWVFHSQINQTKLQKTTLSEAFDEQYGDDPDSFISFIDSLPRNSNDYYESWRVVFDGEIEPLQKLTNLKLLLEWMKNI